MVERISKQGPLTGEEQKILTKHIGKSHMESKEDNGITSLINKKTCNELARLYHLDVQTEDPVEFISKESDRLFGLFFEDDESTGTKTFAEQAMIWVNTSFPNTSGRDYTSIHDAMTMGASLALEAFRAQFGLEFVANLKQVKPQDIKEVFDEYSAPIGKGFSQIQMAKKRSLVPDPQINLEELIQKIAKNHFGHAERNFESGAIMAIILVEKLWPKLKPGANANPGNGKR